MRKDPPDPNAGIVLYQSPDGGAPLSVRLQGQTVWLTQAQMAELFQTTPQNITIHVANIYADGELSEDATCKEYLQVRTEGARTVERATKHYSLDMIIAVGYRVRSQRGTQFRQWATATLAEYMTKGFVLDDARLKEARTRANRTTPALRLNIEARTKKLVDQKLAELTPMLGLRE